jgi:hypothetical protein
VDVCLHQVVDMCCLGFGLVSVVCVCGVCVPPWFWDCAVCGPLLVVDVCVSVLEVWCVVCGVLVVVCGCVFCVCVCVFGMCPILGCMGKGFLLEKNGSPGKWMHADTEGIRAPAGRAQWISSPSPWPLGHSVML